MVDAINKLYQPGHVCMPEIKLAALPADDIDKEFQKWIKQIHKGNAPVINREVLKETAKTLTKAVMSGFAKASYTAPDANMINALLNNTWQFAGFKTHAQGVEINKLLVDNKGKARSFAAFQKEAKKVGTIFNKEWLQTEYNHAIAASQGASQWIEIQKTKEALPLLQWDTAGDAKVRPSHAQLDGITLPVDNPFWSTHFVPLDWNCRCAIRQLAGGKITAQSVVDQKKEILGPPRFANPGITKQIFPDDMPFFDVAAPVTAAVVLAVSEAQGGIQAGKVLYDELVKSGYKVLKPLNKSGAYVIKHPVHGPLEKHEETFFFHMYKQNKQVVLLETLSDDKHLGQKWPDCTLNGVTMDLKTIMDTKAVQRRIAADIVIKNRQAQNIVFHIVQPNLKLSEIFRGIKGGVNATEMQSVSLVVQKSEMVTYSREVILGDTFFTEELVKARKQFNLND